MTVREAFSKAFGEVPEGATCHIAASDPNLNLHLWATYEANGEVMEPRPDKWGGPMRFTVEGPDISDRPAEAFLGFFGEAYDKVVQGG